MVGEKHDDNYRRKEDADTRLLIILTERLDSVLKTTEEVKADTKSLSEKQANNPCKVNNLRLAYLERIMWIVVAALVVSTIRAIVPFF